ncbi:MAG: hypothetical protein ACE5K0_04385 [Candidatus Methanofastidiosia archaeon]
MLIGLKFYWDIRKKKFNDFDKDYLRRKMKLLMFADTIILISIFTVLIILLIEIPRWEPLFDSKWKLHYIILFIILYLWDIIATLILERKFLNPKFILEGATKRKMTLLRQYIGIFRVFEIQVLTIPIFGLLYFFFFASLKGYLFICVLSIPRLLYLNSRLPKWYKLMDELYELEE